MLPSDTYLYTEGADLVLIMNKLKKSSAIYFSMEMENSPQAKLNFICQLIRWLTQQIYLDRKFTFKIVINHVTLTLIKCICTLNPVISRKSEMAP